jgi:hypothetical protein
LYFHDDEGPANVIWLDRAPIEAAIAQSKNAIGSTAASVVTKQLTQLPADNVEIELDFSDRSWISIFQVRLSPTLLYVTAVSAFICSKMRPDGFGGMAGLIVQRRNLIGRLFRHDHGGWVRGST